MHPILFEIPTPWGALPIYVWGTMLGLPLCAGWVVVSRLGAREAEKLDPDRMANCFVVTAVGALMGARVLFVLTNPDRFHSFGEIVALQSGGLVAYGADGPVGFELCGARAGSCRYALGEIRGTQVALHAANAADATRVRYGWADSAIVTALRRPAWAIVSASRSAYSGLALSNLCFTPFLINL